jgi:hypothetical protein
VLPAGFVAGAGCVAALCCCGAAGGVLLLQPDVKSNAATHAVRTGNETLIFCMARIVMQNTFMGWPRSQNEFCHSTDLL